MDVDKQDGGCGKEKFRVIDAEVLKKGESDKLTDVSISK